MSVHQVIGCAFAACAVTLLVVAIRRMRSRGTKRKRYDGVVFSAWIAAG